jgi:hypothetical protein
VAGRGDSEGAAMDTSGDPTSAKIQKNLQLFELFSFMGRISKIKSL